MKYSYTYLLIHWFIHSFMKKWDNFKVFLKCELGCIEYKKIKFWCSNFFSGHIFWPKNACKHQNFKFFWYSVHPDAHTWCILFSCPTLVFGLPFLPKKFKHPLWKELFFYFLICVSTVAFQAAVWISEGSSRKVKRSHFIFVDNPSFGWNKHLVQICFKKQPRVSPSSDQILIRIKTI